jgi:hypothetical protein
MTTALELIDQGLTQASATRLLESADVMNLLLDLRKELTTEAQFTPYDWAAESK